MKTLSHPGQLWDLYPISTEECLEVTVGALRIWVKFSNNDWYFADEIDETRQRGQQVRFLRSPKAVPAVEWKRWASGEEHLAVRLSPRMPDRPVVVKPEMTVRIPAGHRATFFVNLPIFVRVSVGDMKPVHLIEVPTVILSNSWFGDPVAGELCYALKTRATREVHLSEVRNDRAVCAVRVFNSTSSEIELQRIAIHVEHLRIYQGEERLYTNGVNATYRGGDVNGQLEYVRDAPDFEPNCRLIQAERTPVEQGFARRTFQAIRSWTGV